MQGNRDVLFVHYLLNFLSQNSKSTWILGVASKQLRLLNGRIADIVEHFWLTRNELKKNVELEFEFFSFDLSQIFWQRVLQPRPNYSYCIFLKGLFWVSLCWVLNSVLCSMSWVFSVFFVPHCAINIWHHMLCYLPNIYN